MRLLGLGVLLLCSSAAFAGVSGTTVLNYTIQNNTTVTANDLHVNVGGTGAPSVTASSPFTATPSALAVDFAGGSVPVGDPATFTLEEVGDNSFTNPAVASYNWTVDGSQVGETEDPIGAYFTFGFPQQQLFLFNNDNSAAHDYNNLFVTQNGNPVLTGANSGTLGAGASSDVTALMDTTAGPLNFGFTDTTSGVTVAGTFTPTPAVPEPTTWGFCALMLLGTCVAVRRRQLRKQ